MKIKERRIAGKKSVEQIQEENEVAEAMARIKRIQDLETKIRLTFCELNRQLEELNLLNACQARGAVDVEDYCDHNLYSQTKFDQDYAKKCQEERAKSFKKHLEFATQTKPNEGEQ